MPRPKSDRLPRMFRLSDDHVDKLKAIADRDGLRVSAGPTVGEPDTTAAIISLIEGAPDPRKKLLKNPR